MPFAVRDGIHLYYKLDGAAGRPPLVLLNSIGTDLALWDRTMPFLLDAFRILRIDTRGHGASDAPAGDYTLAGLAADTLAVMDAAGIDRAAIAGISLGGMIAMEMALTAPTRVTALGLVCTSAALDPTVWRERAAAVRERGMGAVADATIGRFLSPAFAQAQPAVAAGLHAGLLAMTPAGYVGAGAAIRDMNLIDRIGAITVPSVVVAGDLDVSTPFAGHGDRIVAAVAGAQAVHLRSAHLPSVEAPAELATALRRAFLPDSATEAAAETLFESGLGNRRRVLGDAWVDRSLARRTPFNADFQAMITRIAWHEVWGRPGLDERTRRLLVLAITASLGRWEEFRLHARAGLERGGFTRDELKEALMQLAIYAGVPAANTAFAEASAIIADLDGIAPA